jgi:hypothetical protein
MPGKWLQRPLARSCIDLPGSIRAVTPASAAIPNGSWNASEASNVLSCTRGISRFHVFFNAKLKNKTKWLFIISVNANTIYMDVQRWINFEEFVTPSIITIVYVLGVILITLFSLYMLTTVYSAGSSSYFYSSGPSWHFENAIIAVIIFVLGNLLLRIYCEILIVIFKIHDHLNSIDNYFIAMKRNT